MADIRDKGVNFKNSHSLFPTFTTANASAMATGHYLGDTGDLLQHHLSPAIPSAPAGDTVVPFLENDAVLGDVDEHFGGNYLNEETILKMARAKGYQHRRDRQGRPDPDLRPHRPRRHARPAFDRGRRFHRRQDRRSAVGRNEGRARPRPTCRWPRPRAATMARRATPRRRAPRWPTSRSRPISPTSPAKVVLPMFKARDKPFVLVFWSRDPDGTQHNTRATASTP